MQYTSRDVSNLLSFTPVLNGLESQFPVASTFPAHHIKGNPATV